MIAKPAKFNFSRESQALLLAVNPQLVAVAIKALSLSPYDFKVTEGRRSFDRQEELMRAGATRTLKSKHLTGDAIDIAVLDEKGNVTCDFKYYEAVSIAFKKAARELRVPLIWGGDWFPFRDGPHFQVGT